MAKYSLTFSKTGNIRFISHLDLLRLFKRAFKRADIRLVYSQGYNPHPRLSFVQPLSLGYEGLAELLQFETMEEYPEAGVAAALSAQMPEGIRLIQCIRLPESGRSLAARATAAVYRIRLPLPGEGEVFSPETLLAQPSLTAEKRNKKKQQVCLNIRPMIRSLSTMEPAEPGPYLWLRCTLDAGSASNLNPELLVQAIEHHLGRTFPREEVRFIRESLEICN